MEASVLIFGGSRGIGRIIAGHFAEKKYLVSAASRSISGLEYLRRALPERGVSVNTIVADVCVEGQVRDAFEWHKSFCGRSPDVVINAAAIQGPIGPLWTIPPAQWEAALRTDLFGAFLVTKEAINAMIPGGSGVIIHFSGGGSAYARPNFSAYGVAKTGVLRLVETVSEELVSAGYAGICINAVAPGAVRTGMTQEIIESAGKAGERERLDAEKIMQTGGTPPDEIITLIEFLCTTGKEKRISGRLIHVRENYREFAAKFEKDFPGEAGKLRRVPLI